MRRYISVIVLIIAGLLFATEVDAQYGKKKKRRGEEEEEKKEMMQNAILNNLWYGVNIGSPSISNVAFRVGLGPMVAYKFNNVFSAGVITDFTYTYVWNRVGPSTNYLDYSLGVFGRAKFFNALIGSQQLWDIYAHAEYNYTSLDGISINGRENFPVALLGAGYTSGRAPWGYEATLLFDATGNLGTYTNQIPIVYRFGVTYNF